MAWRCVNGVTDTVVLVCYTSTSPTSVDIEVDYLGVVLEVMLLTHDRDFWSY